MKKRLNRITEKFFNKDKSQNGNKVNYVIMLVPPLPREGEGGMGGGVGGGEGEWVILYGFAESRWEYFHI